MDASHDLSVAIEVQVGRVRKGVDPYGQIFEQILELGAEAGASRIGAKKRGIIALLTLRHTPWTF